MFPSLQCGNNANLSVGKVSQNGTVAEKEGCLTILPETHYGPDLHIFEEPTVSIFPKNDLSFGHPL